MTSRNLGRFEMRRWVCGLVWVGLVGCPLEGPEDAAPDGAGTTSATSSESASEIGVPSASVGAESVEAFVAALQAALDGTDRGAVLELYRWEEGAPFMYGRTLEVLDEALGYDAFEVTRNDGLVEGWRESGDMLEYNAEEVLTGVQVGFRLEGEPGGGVMLVVVGRQGERVYGVLPTTKALEELREEQE